MSLMIELGRVYAVTTIGLCSGGMTEIGLGVYVEG